MKRDDATSPLLLAHIQDASDDMLARYVAKNLGTDEAMNEDYLAAIFKEMRRQRFAASETGESEAAHAVLDKHEVSRKCSMDAGETWRVYSLAERVGFVCGAVKELEREAEERESTPSATRPKMPSLMDYAKGLSKEARAEYQHELVATLDYCRRADRADSINPKLMAFLRENRERYQEAGESLWMIEWLESELTKAAASATLPPARSCWLVENGKDAPETRYRTIEQGLPVWTADVNKAIRFARREDADMFAAEDEDAWRIAEHLWHDQPRYVHGESK